MNILIYNWKDLKHPEVGGAEIITHHIAKRLASRGHQVTWFCRSFPGGSERDRYDGIEIVRRGGLLTTYYHGWRYYRSLKQKPDLVIDMLNTIFWQTPLYAHDSKVVAYVNQLAKEVLYYQLPWPLAGFAYQLEPLQFLSYRKTPFVCYAQSTKDDLASVGIPKRNIAVFPLGLDHGRYRPGKKSVSPLFVTVGRLAAMKRNDLVIKAMAEVVRMLPAAKLAIVGEGPEKERLKRLVKQLGLENSVTIADKNVWFFGATSRDQKIELFKQAWALVIPSAKEGWGMVVTEAAACGTPTIGTNVTGLKDSIKHGKTGVLVSANPSPAELAEAMITLATNPKRREKLSRNTLKFAKTLDWDRSFNEFRTAVKRASGVML
ncbi:glycosyltransferase family 4 protein [Candidatus Berkelbacteria bacterium]|nr:glycosyltransferase family 4 protein [Candidatus Berkelbacteria bacterium]